MTMHKAVGTELRNIVATKLGIAPRTILYAPVDIAMRLNAESNPDSVLNFTSMYKTAMEFDNSRFSHFASRNPYGVLWTDSSKEYARTLRFIPKNITYSIESWFVKPDCMDERIEFFDAWLHADNFLLQFTDTNSGIAYEFPVLLQDQVDNSDLEEFERGKIFRLTTELIVQALIPVGQPEDVVTINTVELDLYGDIDNPVLLEEIEVTG